MGKGNHERIWEARGSHWNRRSMEGAGLRIEDLARQLHANGSKAEVDWYRVWQQITWLMPYQTSARPNLSPWEVKASVWDVTTNPNDAKLDAIVSEEAVEKGFFGKVMGYAASGAKVAADGLDYAISRGFSGLGTAIDRAGSALGLNYIAKRLVRENGYVSFGRLAHLPNPLMLAYASFVLAFIAACGVNATPISPTSTSPAVAETISSSPTAQRPTRPAPTSTPEQLELPTPDISAIAGEAVYDPNTLSLTLTGKIKKDTEYDAKNVRIIPIINGNELEPIADIYSLIGREKSTDVRFTFPEGFAPGDSVGFRAVLDQDPENGNNTAIYDSVKYMPKEKTPTPKPTVAPSPTLEYTPPPQTPPQTPVPPIPPSPTLEYTPPPQTPPQTPVPPIPPPPTLEYTPTLIPPTVAPTPEPTPQILTPEELVAIKQSIDSLVASGTIITSYEQIEGIYKGLIYSSPITLSPKNRFVDRFDEFNAEYQRLMKITLDPVALSRDISLAYSSRTVGAHVREGTIDLILGAMCREDLVIEYQRQRRGRNVTQLDGEYAGNVGEIICAYMFKETGSQIYEVKDTPENRSKVISFVKGYWTGDGLFSKAKRAVRLHAEARGYMDPNDLRDRISVDEAVRMFDELVKERNPAGFIEALLKDQNPQQVAARVYGGILLTLKPNADGRLDQRYLKNLDFYHRGMAE